MRGQNVKALAIVSPPDLDTGIAFWVLAHLVFNEGYSGDVDFVGDRLVTLQLGPIAVRGHTGSSQELPALGGIP